MIEALLKSLEKPGSKNHFTIDEVRDDVNEWLERVAEEHEQHPETKGDAEWELSARDFEPDSGEDAFVAWVFEAKTVTFAAGRVGPTGAVIAFCESEFEGDATEVIAALKARFGKIAVQSFARADFERWLAA